MTKAYLDLIEKYFPGFCENKVRIESLGYAWPSRPFIKEDKGECVSHVGFLDYPMLLEGKEQKIGAIHAICTKDSHRGQGLASELIQEALDFAKSYYESVILFTEIPGFYEKLGFKGILEHQFSYSYPHPKGSKILYPVLSPKDDALFKALLKNREPLSENCSVLDKGVIAAFNCLFATYPTYGSLHYSPSINGFISFSIKDKVLHLFDVIAAKMPSLELILDHLPSEIEEIVFYFSPDKFTKEASSIPFFYDNATFMVFGNWPKIKPFMIAPLSRC